MAQRSATLTHQSRLPSAGDKQAHYLLVVKASQPALLARCAALPWYAVPELDRTCDRDHGRIELRTLRSYRSLAGAAPSPTTPAGHDRDHLRHHQPHQPPGQPCPARRPHPRALGNRQPPARRSRHHLREDASPLRTGSGPSVMAARRNLVIGVLCQTGPVNLAAALRHHARDPRRPLATLGIGSE
jgi:hypothetical protein